MVLMGIVGVVLLLALAGAVYAIWSDTQEDDAQEDPRST